MTNEPLYRIEEMHPITGMWSIVDERSKGLTKQQCMEVYESHLRNELNPSYMRIVREQ